MLMIMTLGNGKRFNIKSVIQMGEALEITFGEDVKYADVAKVYDEAFGAEEYSEEALRKFELYTDKEELQGVHYGYTITQSIFAFGGEVKATVRKESELKTEVKSLQRELAEAQVVIEELQDMVLAVSMMV